MNIMYFSPIAYDDLKQRPQYIAEGLSQKNEVVFVEPTIRGISCLLRKLKGCRGRKNKIMGHLTVVRCDGRFVLPFRWNVVDFFAWNSILERKYLRLYLDKADVIIVGFEGWTNVLNPYKDKIIIYDKMDDNVLLASTKSYQIYLARMERKLLTMTNAMIVTAQKFADDYSGKVERIVQISNGVEQDICMPSAGTTDNNQKIYGYVGMISDWLDMEAIKTISAQVGTEIVMVGPCNTEIYEAENITYVGRVPKTKVGEKIRSFDVCLYPFKTGSILDTINPVKIYEYLAENKPVIAVDGAETRKFGNLIYRYRTMEELCDLIHKKLEPPFRNVEQLRKYIEGNSWKNRVERLELVMEELENESNECIWNKTRSN